MCVYANIYTHTYILNIHINIFLNLFKYLLKYQNNFTFIILLAFSQYIWPLQLVMNVHKTTYLTMPNKLYMFFLQNQPSELLKHAYVNYLECGLKKLARFW